MNINNVLIIGAHYDDAELGCGGTAAKLLEEGKKVFKLTLTDNKTDFKQYNIQVNTNDSLISSKKACKELGGVIEISAFAPKECNCLAYDKDTMQQIEKIIFDNNIDTVFIHNKNDVNQDHVAAAQLSLTASRHCKNIFAYQSNNYIFDQAYYPTFFIDISKQIEKKKNALACYGKEHNRFDRLFDSKIELNHIWGAQNKVDYAEGFVVIKALYD